MTIRRPPHPNTLTGAKRPEARRLASDRVAARTRRDQIVAMRKAGISVVEIAKLYNISRDRVYQLLHKAAKP